jgi:hypothetical protein
VLIIHEPVPPSRHAEKASAFPRWVAVGLVAALLAVVGATARGPLTTESRSADQTAAGIAVVPALVVLGAAVSAGLALLVLAGVPRRSEDEEQREMPPAPASLALRIAVVVVPILFVVALGAVAVIAARHGDPRPRGTPSGLPALPADRSSPDSRGAWMAAALVVGLALGAVAITALLLLDRRGRRAPGQSRSLRAVRAAAVEDALAALRAERDPRRAIIAAYARMERALADAGLGRRDPEAPREYLARVAGGLGDADRAATRLTALYEEARFSPHPLDGGMRAEAIAAFTALRDAVAGSEA